MQKVHHLYILSHRMALFFPRPKKYGTSQHLNLSASPMAAQPGRIVFGILGATLRLGGFGDGLELEGVLHHGPTAIHLLALGLLGGMGWIHIFFCNSNKWKITILNGKIN